MSLSGIGARLLHSLSPLGILFAVLMLAASLTPSLMPRTALVQGTLSGCCAAFGYMVGVFVAWLWQYLELPRPVSLSSRLRGGLAAAAAVIAIPFISRAADWQNSTRVLWDMEPLDSAEPLYLTLVAFLVFLVALVLGRLFKLGCLSFSQWLNRFVPRRISRVLGLLLSLAIVWSVGQGILLQWTLDAADASFQTLDQLVDEDVAAPTDPAMTGSSASLVSWEGLGRQGRHFVASGPRAAAISGLWGAEARDPLRVYVGLNNASGARAMAVLALQELQRQRAFERSVLVVVVPTGTGWIDPAAMDTLEYLHRGDVASVALQYSYLTSWLSLLMEPDNGREAARALFAEVYNHWKSLPTDRRPRLYLHGLSLGALNSELSTDIYDVVGDPFHGALWSGPPFRSQRWRTVTAQREPGSPAWLPRFRDGSVIRFANQNGFADQDFADWGPIRIVYLQYASDPVTFFDPSSFYSEPAWMRSPRGPDVSESFRWFPVVTTLQLVFDMAFATTSPMGHGHVYAPAHYIAPWIAVTDPPGVTPDVVTRLEAIISGPTDP